MGDASAPFETSSQAHAAAVAAVAPKPGSSVLDRGGNIRLLFLALEAAGVETGAHENRIAAWLADFEDSTVAVIARWVNEAARRPGEVTLWGVRSHADKTVVQRYGSEADARQARRDVTALGGTPGPLVSRQAWAGPWEEVPDA